MTLSRTVISGDNLRSCLAKIYTHFATVNFSMAIRTTFSDVAVNNSTSFDSLLKFPSQAKVLSTIHLFLKTANPSLILIEMLSLIFRLSSTNLTAVPRYPPSPEKASIVGYLSSVLSRTSHACLVSLRFAAWTETWSRFPRISTTICLLCPLTFLPPSNPISSLANWVLTLWASTIPKVGPEERFFFLEKSRLSHQEPLPRFLICSIG